MNSVLNISSWLRCLLGLVLFMSFPTRAQLQALADTGDVGVRFERDLTWTELFKKAEAEQKLVLFEVYTTWCAPCKHLEANVYPKKEVGDFFNKHFVNFKIQIDRKDSDDAYTRSRYALADSLKEVFDISVFPTFFFLNSQGDLLHVMTGAGDPIPEFLDRIAEGLDPQKQYYSRVKVFENSVDKDTANVSEMAKLAASKYDWERAKKYSGLYFDLIADEVNSDILAFAKAFNRASDYRAFSWLVEHRQQIDSQEGKGYTDGLVMDVMLKEEFYGTPYYSAEEVDWRLFRQQIAVKYPYYADMFSAYAKVQHVSNSGDWGYFAKELRKLIKKYDGYIPFDGLKSFSWYMVRHVTDRDLLEKGLEWMPRIYKDEDNYNTRQTEALLLYKLGQTELAVQKQEKVVADAHEFRRDLYQKLLDRMKAGKPLFE